MEARTSVSKYNTHIPPAAPQFVAVLTRGPHAGVHTRIPHPKPEVLMPSLPTPIQWVEGFALPMTFPEITVEKYERYRQINGTDFEYRWVDDRPAMRKQIRDLENRLASIRKAVRETL